MHIVTGIRWVSFALALLPAVTLAAPGEHFSVSPDTLAAPNTTLPNGIDPNFTHANFLPVAPKGFHISAFASGLTHARWLAVAPNGDVFLSEPNAGKITVLRDTDGDGKADIIQTFAAGFMLPHGLVFQAGALYVGDVRAIWRIPYKDGDMTASAAPVRVTKAADLRPGGLHYTRNLASDSKAALYLTMGARDDLNEDPSPDATVQRVAPDGTMETFAGGMRNPVGMAFYPGTDDLWVTVNERDGLGARLPPDYLAHIAKGDFLGWPYAYDGPHPDPLFGAKRPDLVRTTMTPEILFEAHSAPLGLAFYDGRQFPAEYRGDAFVALHGTGPYDNPTGYKVVRIKFANGKPVGGYDDFLTGFWTPGPREADGTLAPAVAGTPVGIAVAKDGSLLVSDDKAQTIWRVAYTGN